jgi:hypothetical protein
LRKLRRTEGLSAALAASLTLVGAGRPCLGAGVEHPDVGTVALGRGGAYAAEPDGGLALIYNPAGLGRQAGFRATVDTSLAWQRLTFAPD